LRTYPRHPETKFQNGYHGQVGVLERRRVVASSVVYIGKEADRWDDDEQFGLTEDSAIEHEISEQGRIDTADAINGALKYCTYKQLAKAAGVSEHTISRARKIDQSVKSSALHDIARAAEALILDGEKEELQLSELLTWAREEAIAVGMTTFAANIAYDAANLQKILSRGRNPSAAARNALIRYRSEKDRRITLEASLPGIVS
jgi:transcriptional regulator with XRE-family HTH domain